MGLQKALSQAKYGVDPDVVICPRCEEKAEETDHYYYRCPKPLSECSILNIIPSGK